MRWSLDVQTEASPELDAALDAGLEEHGAGVGAPPYLKTPLRIAARTGDGQLLGGLAGYTVAGWLYVDRLWVAASRRGGGLGSELLGTAEAEARRRGCHSVYLDTLSYQARPFYERLGYRVFGTLDDFPPGHRKFFMTKALAPT